MGYGIGQVKITVLHEFNGKLNNRNYLKEQTSYRWRKSHAKDRTWKILLLPKYFCITMIKKNKNNQHNIKGKVDKGISMRK